ncbi:MAG: hypothetical protein ACNA71_03255 [Kiritimatiellia bacterium]
MMERDEVLVDYVAGLYRQFPDIRPYDMDDWDFSWADDGYQFLEGCDFGMAELTFQRLIAARPDDPDGYEGLALVYQATGVREWAVLLIDEAVRLADERVKADLLDQEVLGDIVAARDRIHAMPRRQAEEASDALGAEEE